jgi:hypothetical protein
MGVRVTGAEAQMLRNQTSIMAMLSELQHVPGLAISRVSVINKELLNNTKKTYELLEKATVVNE